MYITKNEQDNQNMLTLKLGELKIFGDWSYWARKCLVEVSRGLKVKLWKGWQQQLLLRPTHSTSAITIAG